MKAVIFLERDLFWCKICNIFAVTKNSFDFESPLVMQGGLISKVNWITLPFFLALPLKSFLDRNQIRRLEAGSVTRYGIKYLSIIF